MSNSSKLLATPLSAVIAVFLFLATILVAFLIGTFFARQDARNQMESELRYFEGSESAQTLRVISVALQSIKSGDNQQSEKILVAYAQIKAARVRECARIPTCAVSNSEGQKSLDEFARALR